MRIRAISLLLMLVCGSAYPFAEYYSLSRSIRALGMGNAFHGLADDEGALFYNPAGLALYQGGTQLFLASAQGAVSSGTLNSLGTLADSFSSGTDDASGLVENIVSLQGQLNSLGVGVMPFFLTRGFALGILLGDVKMNMALLGRDFDSELDVTVFSDHGLFLAKSLSLGKNFHVGITGKLLFRLGGRKNFTVLDFAQQTPVHMDEIGGSGGGLDMDVGFTWEASRAPLGKRFGVSGVVQNLLATEYPWFRNTAAGTPPALARTGAVGVYSVFDNGMSLRLDVAHLPLGGQQNPHLGARGGNFFKHLDWGVEYPVTSVLALRSGFHQGLFTAGFGVTLPFMRLDFATYGEEMGTHVGTLSSRRYALRLALGFAAPPYLKK